MKNILLILWMLSSFLSCKKNKGEKDDSLCSARSANNSGTIKLNGYYYYEYGNGAYRELYFLYSNGVLVSPGVVDSANFDEIDDYLNTNDFYTYYKSSKLNWGIYSIQDSVIKIEKWYPSNNKLFVYVREGQILNDSTYNINRVYRCNGSEDDPDNETFRFKAYAPKPDSTNSYTN